MTIPFLTGVWRWRTVPPALDDARQIALVLPQVAAWGWGVPWVVPLSDALPMSRSLGVVELSSGRWTLQTDGATWTWPCVPLFGRPLDQVVGERCSRGSQLRSW